MRQPLRSQSFKHRARPTIDPRRYPLDEANDLDDSTLRERRRSTPNISRRFSQTQRVRMDPGRTDVWPEPKVSTVEERYLKLPDSEDYTRVRQLQIDETGAVISRGDSFRLKSPTEKKMSKASIVPRSNTAAESESDSSGSAAASNESSLISSSDKKEEHPSTSTQVYKILVLGTNGVGKTALIGQFLTSDFRNTFATDIEQVDNTVSIIIGGKESDLVFYEADPYFDDSWLDYQVHIYLLVYSIDSKSSFRQAMYVVERLRESASTKNIPIIMAANKIDLERKRVVSKTEVKDASMTFAFTHYEISVALNLEVDDLLVGLIAEIKESLREGDESTSKNDEASDGNSEVSDGDNTDFKAAIRRYSKRKRQQMGKVTEAKTNKCTHLKLSFIQRIRSWRQSLPKLSQ